MTADHACCFRQGPSARIVLSLVCSEYGQNHTTYPSMKLAHVFKTQAEAQSEGFSGIRMSSLSADVCCFMSDKLKGYRCDDYDSSQEKYITMLYSLLCCTGRGEAISSEELHSIKTRTFRKKVTDSEFSPARSGSSPGSREGNLFLL